MHDFEIQTDEEILQLSLENPMYFEVLVDRYQKAFLRKSKYILKNEKDAEDVVQDTFVKIYTAGKSFQKQSDANFSSWAYTILINTCFSAYAKQKRDKNFTSVLDAELMDLLPNGFEVEMKRKTDFDEVLSYISKLPDIFKEVAKKFYIEGNSGKEIADSLDISENVVRTRLHRARNELKRDLRKGR